MINERDPFQLVCEVTANPIPEVVWLRRSEGKVTNVLDTSSRVSIGTQYRSMEALSMNTLAVSRAVPSDGGEYVCEASNTIMPARTIVATKMLQITGSFVIL